MKKLFKRLNSTLLALMLAISLFPISAAADDAAISFTINVDNNINITYSLKEVNVPTPDAGTYKSMYISYPIELSCTYTTPPGWTDTTRSTKTETTVTFIFTAGDSAENMKSFLESLSFSLKNSEYPPDKSSIRVGIDSDEIAVFPDENGTLHYYEFISFTDHGSSLTWLEAYNQAKLKTYKGLKGYLATITSQAEEDMIYYSIATQCGWLGGTRMLLNDGSDSQILDPDSITVVDSGSLTTQYVVDHSKASYWYWACGPETGKSFYSVPYVSVGDGTVGRDIDYSFWNPNEPNNAGDETVLQFAYYGERWNDYKINPDGVVQGFYVEYGGYPNETPDKSDTIEHEAFIPQPITVIHRNNEDGSAFETSPYIFGNIGDSYSTDKLSSIPKGYEFIKTSDDSAPVSGNFGNKKLLIIYLYELTTISVSFNVNADGDLHATVSPDKKDAKYTKPYGTLPNPVRPGYTFNGWHTLPTGGSQVTAASIVSELTDHELFAKWSENSSYAVKYDLNGGDGNIDPVTNVKWTDKGFIPNTSPTRKGYTFSGWTLSEKSVSNSDSYAMLANYDNSITEITLKANWELDATPETHDAYLFGYPDGTVRPENNINRQEVATIFFRLMEEDVRTENYTSKNSFSDVNLYSWSNKAISTAAKAGIIKGYPDGRFRPQNPITRAEFASIAVRLAKGHAISDKTVSDISGHWGEAAISSAISYGWMEGYDDGTFLPNQYITRAEVARIINRITDRCVSSANDMLSGMTTFTDNSDIGKWYYFDLQEATNTHSYVRKTKDSLDEKWAEILPDFDWKPLESPPAK